DEVETYTPSSVPGGRAPHLWLHDSRGPGSSLFDRLGRYFTLLRIGSGGPGTRRVGNAAGPPRPPPCRLQRLRAAGGAHLGGGALRAPAQSHQTRSSHLLARRRIAVGHRRPDRDGDRALVRFRSPDSVRRAARLGPTT